MAAATAFSGQPLGEIICSSAASKLAFSRSPSRKSCPLQHIEMKRLQHHICMKSGTDIKRNSRFTAVVSSMSNPNIRLNPSPSDTIKQFYACINEKNLKQLRKFISNDCFFQDLSFSKPFQGRKEVLQFFEQLIASMGQNIEFNVGHVCEGDDFIVGVNWHLDWKNRQVPFTRGCSFYELSKEGERLVIRKAQVVIESPIKPGGLVMGLLKIVTSLFDAFPEATEWFLKSPHFILQHLLKIYNILLGPFISPLLPFYINLGNFLTRLLIFTIKILLYISKIFNR